MTTCHHMMNIIPGTDTLDKVKMTNKYGSIWSITTTDAPLIDKEYEQSDLAYQVCKRLVIGKCILLDIIVYSKDPNEDLDKIQMFAIRTDESDFGWEFRDKYGRRYSGYQLFIKPFFKAISCINGVLYVSKDKLNLNELCRP